MLPTFVIGLREGLEAALIVGIVAAFLKQQGKMRALRQVWLGVGLAVLLCVGIGVGLKVLEHNLPQKQQEGLETIIAAVAVAMVSYMVVWMKRHSKDLRRTLQGAAGSALAAGSGLALVLMAFLAVLREGIETAVFLLATFDSSGNVAAASSGAILGVLVAVVLGYAIYRGGVKLNLSKFFRATGLVLVLVAAGLVMFALHTAHEAGWLNSGQHVLATLPGAFGQDSVLGALATGVFGIQQKVVVAEVIGWVLYAIPMGLFVAWPQRRPSRPAAATQQTTTAAAA
jgi:high-affinity iron transporter